MFIRAGVWILVVLVGSICFVEFIVKLGEKCLEENACCSKNMYKTPLLILQYNKPKLSSTFLMFELWKALYYLDYNLYCTPYFVQSLVRSILFNGACLKVICYHVGWNQKQLGHAFPMFWKSLGLFCCGPRGTVVDEKYDRRNKRKNFSLLSTVASP